VVGIAIMALAVSKTLDVCYPSGDGRCATRGCEVDPDGRVHTIVTKDLWSKGKPEAVMLNKVEEQQQVRIVTK